MSSPQPSPSYQEEAVDYSGGSEWEQLYDNVDVIPPTFSGTDSQLVVSQSTDTSLIVSTNFASGKLRILAIPALIHYSFLTAKLSY